MHRKIFSLIGAILLMFVLVTGAAFAAGINPVKIIVNGQAIRPAVEPQIINGTLLLPARAIAEGLGAEVNWDAASNSVRIETNEPSIIKDILGELAGKYTPVDAGGWLRAIRNSNSSEKDNVALTPAIKREFNQLGNDYLFFFMPQVDWYNFGPAVYEPTGEALSYILFVWQHQFGEFPAMPKYEAEAWLRSIFAAPDDNYPLLEHKEYGKCVLYDGKVYTPWPESYNDHTIIYDLTQLKVQQEGEYTYYRATADEYQFDAQGYYEPGENEKFLATKAEALGLDHDTALEKLLATGDIAAANKSKTYTVEFRFRGDDTTPQIVSVRKTY